ncbi:MAG: RNA polymerase sigma factor [Sandaracinus sp.]
MHSVRRRRAPTAPQPQPEALPDEALVARARSGDRWAFEVIFRRHVEAILGMATRLLGSTSEADDVAQDTFQAAFERLERLDDPTRLRSWLMGIAVHRARRRLRARRVLHFFGLGPDAGLYELASGDASPEVRADLVAIDALLARLPVEERIAWTLRHVEGERLEEIAQITGASLATVKRRIGAVEVRMRAMLERGAP